MRLPRAGEGVVLRALHHLGVHKAFRASGIHVDRYTPHLVRRDLMDSEGVGVVFDVGANTGQYGKQLRSHGYRGRIISFEPVSTAFEVLSEAAALSDDWSCSRLALGDTDGEGVVQVTANSQSSSLLAILDRHASAMQGSQVVSAEDVPLARLDSVAPGLVSPAERLMLKLDVQGFEDSVLRGARRTLERVRVVECEMSFVPLYEGQALVTDIVRELENADFLLIGLFEGFKDQRTGEILQMDGLFVRRS
jgi:FkbM family methyltransferase